MFKIISSVISDRFCAQNINISSADCASGHLTRLKSIFVFLMLFRSSYLKIIFVFCSVLCSGPNIKSMFCSVLCSGPKIFLVFCSVLCSAEQNRTELYCSRTRVLCSFIPGCYSLKL